MRKYILYGILRIALVSPCLSTAVLWAIDHDSEAISVVSPDGRVRLSVHPSPEGPKWSAGFDGEEIVLPSRLGIRLAGGNNPGVGSILTGVSARSVVESFTQVTGKRRDVRVESVEMELDFAQSGMFWKLRARASNDGVAFRYEIPSQPKLSELRIQDELTEFRIPGDSNAWVLPLNGFTTSYEARYSQSKVSDIPSDSLLALPVTFKTQGGVFAAISEANIYEYAGLYLKPTSNGDSALEARLSPLPGGSGEAVRHSLPHVTPWRVVLASDRAGALVESDFVLSLNEPCAIGDTSWIRSGKTTFPWWNGFYEDGLTFPTGLNTATAKYYIDFCAEAGIPLHSLDGLDNTAWYGGKIVPYEGADITTPIEGLDLYEILDYAREKGIRIRLWMHWKGAEKYMAKAFPLYREWGIEGIMLDFMDRDDQDMNRFVRKAVALAAENHLTITLHGCPKPTGMERTYPNLLTHEGVMNLEYDKWDPVGIPADHELVVPFTRMLAGPLDFHQGSFRTVSAGDFSPHNDAPLIMGTPSRTLASYVVYQNHLSMVADYPSAYRGHPALPALVDIPTTWDDTRVIAGEIGEYIAVARKAGSRWYVGVMVNNNVRKLSLPLDFLEHGNFSGVIHGDDGETSTGFVTTRIKADPSDRLDLKFTPGGGALIILSAE